MNSTIGLDFDTLNKKFKASFLFSIEQDIDIGYLYIQGSGKRSHNVLSSGQA